MARLALTGPTPERQEAAVPIIDRNFDFHFSLSELLFKACINILVLKQRHLLLFLEENLDVRPSYSFISVPFDIFAEHQEHSRSSGSTAQRRQVSGEKRLWPFGF